MATSPKFKSVLYKKCVEYIDQRISYIQNAYNEATESGNDETKSSAGDKHETGRAMMQIEQEKIGNQLKEATELKKNILKIDPTLHSEVISVGSVVITNKGNFYISISAGKIEVEGVVYFAISPQSPIALKLLGLSANDELVFNGQNYKVKAIY